ncbi:helix-turn-helix domain-containing protein [Pseudomonadota bacterium]
MTFGNLIRKTRMQAQADDRKYSLRKTAERIGIQPSYLSKIERDELPPPGEQVICRLADDLGLDADVLLAMAGKVSSELQEVIRTRPELFGALLRELKSAPDNAVLRLVREVRDGEW